jgi:peptidoglycan/LPS O-acetylase OafA/YrhL
MLYAPSAALPLRNAAGLAAHARAVPYRPEIDGLRGISVLAVILFHVEVPGFRGGFVGVDVFFVISGYLITQLLLAPSEKSLAGRLRDFYVRRCRRILPALLVMLAVTAGFACWLFLPGHLKLFGAQLSATSVFAANLVAWRNGGYFDAELAFSPLAHIWSIAVEEQFYIFFPLFFLASNWVSKRVRFSLFAAIALLSFTLCVWGSHYSPYANFYLAPTRAWELLLGSLVALGLGRSLVASRARDTLAGAASLVLVACVIGYDGRMPYPGLHAIAPCAATAILLATCGGQRSRVGGALRAQPLVFTGLISYSLYLWHLPVLSFAAYYSILRLEPRHLAVLLPAIYLLAALSWRYIEAPVRARTMLGSDSKFLTAAGVATLAIALLGLALWISEGMPGRVDASDVKSIAMDDRLQRDATACANRSVGEIAAGSLCEFGPSSGRSALVWGDSHALALLPAYERLAIQSGVRVRMAVRSACRPLLDAASTAEPFARRRACDAFNAAAVGAIGAIDPDVVILNAYWTFPDLAILATVPGAAVTDGPPPFEEAFERTLRAIGPDRKVCVVGGVPTLSYHTAHAYWMARKRGIDTAFLALSSADAAQQHGELDRHFAELERRNRFTFVDPKAALCRESTCMVSAQNGDPLYRDKNHLSPAGALVLARALEACFD